MNETRPRFRILEDPHMVKMLDKYSGMDPEGTRLWLETLDDSINDLFSLWKIVRCHTNSDAYLGIVLECDSSKYGETVFKMYPPFLKERYLRESYIYQKLQNYPQCELLDHVPGKYAMLLRKVSPGSYISYPQDGDAIIRLFKDIDKNKVPVSALNDLEPAVPRMLQQAKRDYMISKKCGFHPDLTAYLLNEAEKVYEEFFSKEEKYLLHGDVYFKNALRGQSGIQIIDPRGYQDAYVFEYIIFFVQELGFRTSPREYLNDSKNLIRFFQKFADTSKFYPAAFIFLITTMFDSLCTGNDQFKRPNTRLALIRTLFLDEKDRLTFEKVMP